jgi:hypothetical protein
MFLKYQIHKNYSIKIIDTDFMENIPTNGEGNFIFHSVISCYEKRNLNVGFNLVRYFICRINENYGTKNILAIAKNYEREDPELYNKYKIEIEKYLTLI